MIASTGNGDGDLQDRLYFTCEFFISVAYELLFSIALKAFVDFLASFQDTVFLRNEPVVLCYPHLVFWRLLVQIRSGVPLPSLYSSFFPLHAELSMYRIVVGVRLVNPRYCHRN